MQVELPAWLLGSIVRLTHLAASVGRASTLRVARGPYTILLSRIFVFGIADNPCPYGTRRLICDLLPGLEYRHQYEELPVTVRRYSGEIIAWANGWSVWSDDIVMHKFTKQEQSFIHAGEAIDASDAIYFYPYQDTLDSAGEIIEVGCEIIGHIIYIAFRQMIESSSAVKMVMPADSLRMLNVYFNLPDERRRVTTDTIEESLYGKILTQSIGNHLLVPYSKKRKARKTRKTPLLKTKATVPKEFIMECVTILETVFNLKAMVQYQVDIVPRTYEMMALPTEDSLGIRPGTIMITL